MVVSVHGREHVEPENARARRGTRDPDVTSGRQRMRRADEVVRSKTVFPWAAIELASRNASPACLRSACSPDLRRSSAAVTTGEPAGEPADAYFGVALEVGRLVSIEPAM